MITRQPCRYLAVIPARAGSEGIPRKNLRPVAGRPLVSWSIDHVRQCATPMQLIVSTDSQEIAEVAVAAGAEVPELRPPHLALSTSPTEPAVLHALGMARHRAMVQAVVLLQPTSPVRDAGSLDAAISLFEASGADSLLSVVEEPPFLWRNSRQGPEPMYDTRNRPRRQDLGEEMRVYRETGSIYITERSLLERTANRLSSKPAMYVMRPHEGIDVDTEHDLYLASQWIESHHDN